MTTWLDMVQYKNELQKLLVDSTQLIFKGQDIFDNFEKGEKESLKDVVETYNKLKLSNDDFKLFFENNFQKMRYIDNVKFNINKSAIMVLMTNLELYLQNEYGVYKKGECKL